MRDYSFERIRPLMEAALQEATLEIGLWSHSTWILSLMKRPIMPRYGNFSSNTRHGFAAPSVRATFAR